MLFSRICSGVWWKKAQINTSTSYWFLRTTKQHQVQTSRNIMADGKLKCMRTHFKGYAMKLIKRKPNRLSQQTVPHSQLTNTIYVTIHNRHTITTTPQYDLKHFHYLTLVRQFKKKLRIGPKWTKISMSENCYKNVKLGSTELSLVSFKEDHCLSIIRLKKWNQKKL